MNVIEWVLSAFTNTFLCSFSYYFITVRALMYMYMHLCMCVCLFVGLMRDCTLAPTVPVAVLFACVIGAIFLSPGEFVMENVSEEWKGNLNL